MTQPLQGDPGLVERRIIAARQLDDSSITLEELGHELGISKERVRQLEQRALSRLRRDVLALAGQSSAIEARAAGAP